MRKLLFIILFSLPALSQTGVFYQFPVPLPGATFRVCPVGSQNPCPSPQPIFSDQGLTQSIGQPAQTGVTGQFGFFVAAGQYMMQVGQPYNFVYLLNLGGGGGGGTVTHTGGALTSAQPVVGNGAADVVVATKTGTTTNFVTANGAFINGNCPKADASGNLVDSGVACATVTSPGFLLPTAVTGYNIYGDSISIGFGLNPATQEWPYLVSKGTNIPILNNFAVSGFVIQDEIGTAVPITTSLATASMGLLGANDLPFQGLPVDRYAPALQFLVTWLGLLPASKDCTSATAQCAGGTITYSGTWTNFTTPPGLQGKFSTTVADTATATVTGTAIYVGYWVANSFVTHFDVLVDGVSQGPFTISDGNNANGSNEVLRLPGFSNASHTVVMKVVAGGGDATMLFVGANGGSSFPVVVVGNTIPRPSNETIPHVVAQNANMAAMLAGLVADGLSVIPVNSYSVMSSAITTGSPFYQSDNIHPNSIGSALLGGVFLNTLFQQPTTVPTTPGLIAPAATPSTFSTAYTNATTTFSNVPNLAFDIAGNTAYHIICSVVWQNNTGNDGIKYQWTFTQPGSSNILASLISTGTSGTGGSTSVNKTVTAFNSALANDLTTITSATNFLDRPSINFTSGTNGGVLQLQAAANVGGTITIATGSSCTRQ